MLARIATAVLISLCAPASWGAMDQLVFSDEFETDGPLDPSKWTFETGGGGWGNGELQNYTDRAKNARVEDGHLVIEAHKEDFEGDHFTSARVLSVGKGWKFGRVEVRAKVAPGTGSWPAIWMMPKNVTHGDTWWPDNGEIDIMEYVGREPNQILSCFYTKNFNWMLGTGITKVLDVPGAADGFHVFTLDWDENQIAIGMDGNVYNVFPNPRTSYADWPFDHEFYLIMNVALGGFGGDVDDSIFPTRMLVDYVRVYQPLSR